MGDLGLAPWIAPSLPLHGWGITPLLAHAAAVGTLHHWQRGRATGPASCWKGAVNMQLMEPESRPFPRRVSPAEVWGLVCERLWGSTAGTGDRDMRNGRMMLVGALAKGVWWLMAASRYLASVL